MSANIYYLFIMSTNIYYMYLLLLYLSRKELCRQIGLQMFKRNILAKLSQLSAASLFVGITPFFFSIIIINI